VTISGGEPFLYKDIDALVGSLYDNCRPAIINIPTNGLLHQRIPIIVEQIAEHCLKSQIVINLSIDEIGERHDAIRGVPGSYKKALRTYAALRAIDAPNLTVGIHTVISKYNAPRLPQIYAHLRALEPDSYVTEIAEERAELGTIGADITPANDVYADAIDSLVKRMRNDHFSSIGRITRAFRLQYYRLVKKTLREKRQAIPCYAGIASAQIAPDGDVWMCCTKAESIGNLKKANYDFATVWTSQKARMVRERIKNKECFCPLANAGYTNMLFDPKTVLRAGYTFMKNS
jgi:MoaA/NifB/PqqE/SkfB family radical SAM enzyme